LTEKVPALIETEMKKLGGLYECKPDWNAFAVTDGKLVTGQNPQSSTECAKQALAAM
jgi:putative intracellular protease/amidase